MNQADTPLALTTEELNELLAPVPLELQQRDALLRVALRPELPAGYVGPVELADLRLALSPWQWLRQELATTPQTATLNQRLAEARAAGDRLDTLAEVAEWVSDELFDDEKGYARNSTPGDSMEWGYYGILSDQINNGSGHFLPPVLDIQVVIFWGDDDGTQSDDLVAVQVQWEDATLAAGPIGLFARAVGRSGTDWLHNANSLWLTDSSTGQRSELTPDWEESDDESESEHPAGWAGQPPGAETPFNEARCPMLTAGLRYAAGQLYRADTNALLTLSLTRPQAATASTL